MAQRVDLQDFFAGNSATVAQPIQAGQLPQIQLPQVQLPQLQAPQFQTPQNLIPQGSIGNFTPIDPSQVPNPSFPVFPRVTNPFPAPGNGLQVNPAPGFNPGLAPQGFPSQAPIQGGLQTPVFPQGGYQPQGFPAAGPNQWPYQGTGSNWLPPSDWTWPQQAWGTFRNKFLPRVLERPRARQTWIVGDGRNPLAQNDLELATTMTVPNFLGSTQPLRVSPGFIFHWLNGPDSIANPGFDLPSSVYSSYLSFDHSTNPANNFGLENNFTIGFYSDFANTSSDGIRMTGKLVGWSRINDYTVGKFGVEYFDRVQLKLLPAFGVYMAPNPNIRWDLYFPRTKLAHRMPNLGDFEVWGYLGAEYGGGSWAIDRADGSSDQADINDVRSFLGFEWMGPRRRTGFLELGYVFEREIVYRSDPDNQLDLEDAFMLRSGLAF